MAISETSNAASRTIGLKPLLVGEYCAKSSVTESDLIDPSFSAAVQGWSPSNVRSRIVTSVGLRFVVIDQPCFRWRLAYLVHSLGIALWLQFELTRLRRQTQNTLHPRE